MGDAAFVEEALKKIQGHKGVRGVMVINGDGIPIRQAEAKWLLTVRPHADMETCVGMTLHVTASTTTSAHALCNLSICRGEVALLREKYHHPR